MNTYLCYYELHLWNKTYYIHQLVDAESSSEALDKLESKRGEGFHFQRKGVLAEVDPNSEEFDYLYEKGGNIQKFKED